MIPPPSANPGDPITARGDRGRAEYARRSQVVTPPGATRSESRSGTSVSGGTGAAAGMLGRTYWIELTSAGTGTSAGLYGWRLVTKNATGPGFTVAYPAVSGTVADRPAEEANANGLLPNSTYVPVTDDPRRGRVVFQLENCTA